VVFAAAEMVKSKRAKVISLTKVKRKDKSRKDELIKEVQKAVSQYKYTYLLNLSNQRNAYLKAAREALKPGRIFYGKNKVLQVALGVLPEKSLEENLHHLAKRLTGDRCLLCCDASPEQIRRYCSEFQPEEFAKSGFVATGTVELTAGCDALSRFPHSIEPQLRQLGLPTILKDGRIHLLGDHTVCEQGHRLTPAQAQILKHLGIKMSRFVIEVEAHWTDGAFVEYT